MAGPGLGVSAARDKSGRGRQPGACYAGVHSITAGPDNSAARSSSEPLRPSRPGSPSASEISCQRLEKELWTTVSSVFKGEEVPEYVQKSVRRLTSVGSEHRNRSESDHGGSYPNSPRHSPRQSPRHVSPATRAAVDPVFTAGERARLANSSDRVLSPRSTAARASPQRQRKQGSPDRTPPVFQRLQRDAKERRNRVSEEGPCSLPSHQFWAPEMVQPQRQPSLRATSLEGRGSSPTRAAGRPKGSRDSNGRASRGSSPASFRAKTYLQGVSPTAAAQPSSPAYPAPQTISETAVLTPRTPLGPMAPVASASSGVAQVYSPVLSTATATAAPAAWTPGTASPIHGGQQRTAVAKSACRVQAHERLFKEAKSINERRWQRVESYQEAEAEKLRREAQRAMNNPLGRPATGSTARRPGCTQQGGQRRRSPSPTAAGTDEVVRPVTDLARPESPIRARSPLRARSPANRQVAPVPVKSAMASSGTHPTMQVGRKVTEHRGKISAASTCSTSSAGERSKTLYDEDQSSILTVSPASLPGASSSSASASTLVKDSLSSACTVADSDTPTLAAIDQDVVRRDLDVMKRQLGLLMVGVDVLKRKVATVEATSSSSTNLQVTSSAGSLTNSSITDHQLVDRITGAIGLAEVPCKSDGETTETGYEGDTSASMAAQATATPSSYPISRMTSEGSPPASAKVTAEEAELSEADVASAADEELTATLTLSTQAVQDPDNGPLKDVAGGSVGNSVEDSTDMVVSPSSGTESTSDAAVIHEGCKYPRDRMQQLPLPLPMPATWANGSGGGITATESSQEPADAASTPQRQWVWTGPGGSAGTASPGPVVTNITVRDASVPRAAARGRRREDPVEMCPKRNLADELNYSSEVPVPRAEASGAAELGAAAVEVRREAALEIGQDMSPDPRARAPEGSLNSRMELQAPPVLASRSQQPWAVEGVHAQRNPLSRYCAASGAGASASARVEDAAIAEASLNAETDGAVAEPPITGDIIYNGRSSIGSGRVAVQASEFKSAPLSVENAQNVPFMEHLTARLVELKKAETENSASGVSTPSKIQAEPELTSANGL